MTPEDFKARATEIFNQISRNAGATFQKWNLDTQWPSCTFLIRELSTWDLDSLTQLVIGCHDHCLRAELFNGGPNRIKVRLTTRVRTHATEPISCAHPTIEQAIDRWRNNLSVAELAKKLEVEP